MPGIISRTYLLPVPSYRNSILNWVFKLNCLFENNLKLLKLFFPCICNVKASKSMKFRICSNCHIYFIVFAHISLLTCYHYWFSFHKRFCTNLQKRSTSENSHFYVHLQVLIANKWGLQLISSKMLKSRRHEIE